MASPRYTDRERAALAWTEALALSARTGALEEDHEMLRAQFDAIGPVSPAPEAGAVGPRNPLQAGPRAAHPAGARK